MRVTTEIGTLREAGMFGPPGVESYLAQFYAPKESLFFEQFDIAKARAEFSTYADILHLLDVEVKDLRSAYAMSCMGDGLTMESLIRKLHEKQPKADLATIEQILHEEAGFYGEERTVALNRRLSLDHEYPLGNIFFARDQSNVVDDTCVLSRMKYDIRKPEVNIIRQALYTLGYEKTFQVTQGNLEGGDLMVLGDDVYVGWGPRSEFAAIHEIQQRFPDKNVYGVKAPVNGEWHDDMEIMHLDTFFMPLAEDMAIGCHEVLERCIVTDANKANPRTFLKHLESHGMNTYDIPKEEQRNYAANMVLVRPGLVVVPSGYNAQTRSLLQRHQIGVVDADMRYITNAVGATHCMTLQLKKW